MVDRVMIVYQPRLSRVKLGEKRKKVIGKMGGNRNLEQGLRVDPKEKVLGHLVIEKD